MPSRVDERKLLAAWTVPEFADRTGQVAEVLGISKSDLVRGAVARSLLAIAEGEIAPEPQMETCRNGHERTPETTYLRPDGYRECQVCKREGVYRHREAHRAEVMERDRESKRRYYQAHREEILERRRKHRKENLEKEREKSREYTRGSREKKKREAQ